ncbi:hypothetical protein L1887_24706 [Cichorium endivia]|nr:hypothetical protein L1887_24706 [Cichorium endivia]
MRFLDVFMKHLSTLLQITRVFKNKEYAGVEFTANMEEAKNNEIAHCSLLWMIWRKLEKQTAELQSSLKDADMEEAKNKDIANLESPLKETEVQLVLRNLLSADNEKFQKTFRAAPQKPNSQQGYLEG